MDSNWDGLKAALRMAAEDERKAGEVLSAAQARLTAEEKQAQTLEQYAAEYRQRPQQADATGLRQLSNARTFMNQLEQSCRAQQQVLEARRRDLEAARAHWVAARMKREGMEKVLQQRVAVAARQAEKRAQQLIDDQAGRLRSPAI